MAINVEKYKGFLEGVIKEHGFNDSCLYIVPSIQEWARKNNIEENNPDRAAMVAWRTETNIPDFVFLKVIPDDEIASIKSATMYYGFFNQINKLKDDASFLKHTVLHEIAHAKGIKDEKEADKWAFEKLEECL